MELIAGISGEAPGRARIRVVVCDDEPDLRLLLKVLLAEDPDISVVGEATNGAEAVAAAQSLEPDVVLLDVAMPVMGGLEALPLIKQVSPKSKVIILTGFERGFIQDIGTAYGYLEKGSPSRTLVMMIKGAAVPEQVARA